VIAAPTFAIRIEVSAPKFHGFSPIISSLSYITMGKFENIHQRIYVCRFKIRGERPMSAPAPCGCFNTEDLGTTAGLNFHFLSCCIPYSYHSSVYFFKTSFRRSDVFASFASQFVTTATKAASMSSAPFEKPTLRYRYIDN